MSSIARPPDPCLVAIILIVRSRAGPRLVFHYPPNPLSENGLRPTMKGRRISRTRNGMNRGYDSDFSDASGTTSDEDEEENRQGGSGVSTAHRPSTFSLDDACSSPAGADLQRSGRIHRKRGGNSDVEDGSGVASDREEGDVSGAELREPGESLLGLQMDVWEKLLSPSRAWHKRRFEVGINDLAFVGWPVFVREDGSWRKQRRKKKKAPREWEGGELGHNEIEDDQDEAIEEIAELNDMTDSKQTTSLDAGTVPSAPRDSDDKDAMTMFNVVFVLDPPLLEYPIRVREIYDNIIKKFTKALKWEQSRTDYVWKESQHILHIKEIAREKSMLAASPLCSMMIVLMREKEPPLTPFILSLYLNRPLPKPSTQFTPAYRHQRSHLSH